MKARSEDTTTEPLSRDDRSALESETANSPNSKAELLRRYMETEDDPATIAAKSGLVAERLPDFLTCIYQRYMPRDSDAE